MRQSFILAWALAFGLGACASYEPTSATLRPEAEFTFYGEGAARAAASPISTTAEQEARFDADFNDAGVIAIDVIAQNKGSGSYLVRPSDAILILPDGRRLASSPVGTVVARIDEEGSVIGAAIAFGIIGAVVAQDAEDEAQAARRADYEAKAMPNTALAPGGSKQGVIYFIPVANVGPIDQADLVLRFIDRDTGISEEVAAPLSGIGFKPPNK